MKNPEEFELLDTRINGRIVWVEIARILAIFSVVLLHLDGKFALLVDTANRALFFRGHVPLFFILSAYFLAKNLSATQTPWKLVFKRIVQFAAAFLFFNLLALCIFSWSQMSALFASGNVGEIANFMRISLGVNRMPIDVPTWFLRDLGFYVLLTPMLLKISPAWMLCAVFALLAYPNFLFDSVYSLPAPEYFGYYCAGLFLAKQKISLNQIARFFTPHACKILLLALAVNVIVIYVQYKNFLAGNGLIYWETLNPAARILGIIAYIALACLLLKKFRYFSIYISQFGNAIFFVYITHFLVIKAFRPSHEFWLSLINNKIVSIILMELSPLLIAVGSILVLDLIRKISPGFAKMIALSDVSPRKSYRQIKESYASASSGEHSQQ